jgi:hypothetical protein
MPARGRRHELCDTCGSLRADSPRIETALLPDHPGKELDGQRVLRRRLFWCAANVIDCGWWATRTEFAGRGRRCVVRCGRCVAPALHWQAFRQGERTASNTLAMRRIADFVCKTHGAADRCRCQAPKKTLRLRKSEPGNRGNDLLRTQCPPGLSSMGLGSHWSPCSIRSEPPVLALEPTAEVATSRRNSLS